MEQGAVVHLDAISIRFAVESPLAVQHRCAVHGGMIGGSRRREAAEELLLCDTGQMQLRYGEVWRRNLQLTAPPLSDDEDVVVRLARTVLATRETPQMRCL